ARAGGPDRLRAARRGRGGGGPQSAAVLHRPRDADGLPALCDPPTPDGLRRDREFEQDADPGAGERGREALASRGGAGGGQAPGAGTPSGAPLPSGAARPSSRAGPPPGPPRRPSRRPPNATMVGRTPGVDQPSSRSRIIVQWRECCARSNIVAYITTMPPERYLVEPDVVVYDGGTPDGDELVRRNGLVQAVDRALEVLLLLGGSERGVNELARAIAVDKST